VVVRGGPAAPLVLQVVNEGPDIPPQIRATLFKPFKLESMETANNRRGLGLGLYIVDHIVRGHGGAVGVESTGGLVTFTVTLPPRPA
jgi:signal transduction histidine kinase